MVKRMILLCTLLSTAVGADLAQYVRLEPRMDVVPILKDYATISGFTAETSRWNRDFKGKYGPDWTILIDLRTGRPGDVHGQGIPSLPGLGNDLPYDHPITEADVRKLALAFLEANAAVFSINTTELAAGTVQPMDDFWTVRLQRTYKGLPVQGASIILTISHGNLVSLSCERWGDIAVSTTPVVDKGAALAAFYAYIGGLVPDTDTLTESGTLMLLPLSQNGQYAADYTGGVGQGLDHALIWSFVMERAGEGPWEGLVDARTGQVLAFFGLTIQSHSVVSGKIYYYPAPGADPQTQTVRMPYADIRTDSDACYYTTTNQRCWNASDDQLADPPFCASQNGRFCYDSTTETPYTRLYTPYIGIVQPLGKYLDSAICKCYKEGPEPSTHSVHMCVKTDPVTGLLTMDGEDAYHDQYEAECQYHDLDGDPAVNTYAWNVPGNNFAARTAYWAGMHLKSNWINSMPNHLKGGHGRPVAIPCPERVCPAPEGSAPGLLWWLTNPLLLTVNDEDGDRYEHGPNASSIGTVYLQRWQNTAGQHHVNSGEVPGVLFHEMGHGIDHHDGTVIPAGEEQLIRI